MTEDFYRFEERFGEMTGKQLFSVNKQLDLIWWVFKHLGDPAHCWFFVCLFFCSWRRLKAGGFFPSFGAASNLFSSLISVSSSSWMKVSQKQSTLYVSPVWWTWRCGETLHAPPVSLAPSGRSGCCLWRTPVPGSAGHTEAHTRLHSKLFRPSLTYTQTSIFVTFQHVEASTERKNKRNIICSRT